MSLAIARVYRAVCKNKVGKKHNSHICGIVKLKIHNLIFGGGK
jgi:hypothetical protein